MFAAFYDFYLSPLAGKGDMDQVINIYHLIHIFFASKGRLIGIIKRCKHFITFNISNSQKLLTCNQFSLDHWSWDYSLKMKALTLLTSAILLIGKVINSKYSKDWPYLLAATMGCSCSKILNHGLNHRLFLSLFKFCGWK